MCGCAQFKLLEIVVARPEIPLACDIRADGEILQGKMIQSCELKGENEYLLTWKVPLRGEASTQFAAEAGSALDQPIEPGLITIELDRDDPNKMHVYTYDMTGAPAKRTFHIVHRDQ
jgi:hypothetical protein